MVGTVMIAMILHAPAPRPKARTQPCVAGVYVCDGVTFDALLWFRPDGTYGARWNDNLYEGTWKLSDTGMAIEIREKKMGTTDSPYPWIVNSPGTSGTYQLRKLCNPW